MPKKVNTPEKQMFSNELLKLLATYQGLEKHHREMAAMISEILPDWVNHPLVYSNLWKEMDQHLMAGQALKDQIFYIFKNHL